MDIRNVQKTGNMYYLYLPTTWVRKYNIKSGSKVTLFNSNDGSIRIFPHMQERRPFHLNIDLPEDDQSIINRLMVAAYINPASSFKINLTKEVDIQKLLDQKKLISLEMVEFDGKHISCESSIALDDPISLLRTMARKAKNMLAVLRKGGDKQLLEIYEDEIDRSKLLIEKSVISRLTFNEPSAIRNVYLHYTALISKDLEKAVDQIRIMSSSDKPFIQNAENAIETLLQVFEKIASSNNAEINYSDAILFSKKVDAIKTGQNPKAGVLGRSLAKQQFENIAEVLFDWSVSYIAEKHQEQSMQMKK